MLKVILFAILIVYGIYRIGGFVIKILSFGSTDGQSRVHKNGNVHVDKDPNKDHKTYDGGEYIDYEEVK
jgi:hypothetical protein